MGDRTWDLSRLQFCILLYRLFLLREGALRQETRGWKKAQFFYIYKNVNDVIFIFFFLVRAGLKFYIYVHNSKTDTSEEC